MLKNKYTLNTKHTSVGFTIVELLIVIIVIGIIAAIVIVAYNGITARTIEASMKTDLNGSARALENDKITTGSYPANASSANGGVGLKSSGGNVLGYVTKPYGYCAAVTNPQSTKTFVVKSLTKQIVEGNCDVIMSTTAGTGVLGFNNGPAVAAQFARPEGIAFAPSGIMYIADMNNHRIRAIDTNGNVSTLAGSGTPGFADNPTGSLAQFNYPSGVAVDSTGNVYVADDENNRIRMITPSGAVTTLAGSGTPGFANGTGAAAQFNHPSGVSVDKNDNIYVADSSNHRIRKITQGGVVTTVAGSTAGFNDGTTATALFDFPYQVVVDANNIIYVSDTGNNRVRRIMPDGTVSTLAGSGTYGYQEGAAATAQFAGLTGIALDGSGAVYVVDGDNNRVRVILNGTVSTIAGSGTAGYAEGVGTASQINYARHIAFDTSGAMHIADKWNNRIRKLLP